MWMKSDSHQLNLDKMGFGLLLIPSPVLAGGQLLVPILNFFSQNFEAIVWSPD
jgi:hypothetical protein